MKQKSAIIALVLICFLGCVDVEDVIAPFIIADDTNGVSIFDETSNGNLVLDTVYYQDSLKFTVTFQDNISIDTSIVSITPLGVEVGDSITNWVFFITEQDTLRGSRFVSRTIREEVPATLPYMPDTYTPTGKYIITLFAIDKANGTQVFRDTFLLEDDITPPVFHDLSLDLEVRDGNLFTCPGFSIPISGGISENTQIRRVGYYLNDGTPLSLDVNNGVMENDTLILSEAFSTSSSSAIRIPDNLNNSLVSVTIFVEDFFRNLTEQTFTVNVDCDTKGPDIQVISTSPEANDENIAFVVTDTQFSLDSVVITDESAIDSIEIYFNLQGDAPALYKTYSFDPPVQAVNLGSIDELIFPDPSTVFTQAGLTYLVTVRAYDTVTLFSNTGNVSDNVDLELIIKQDEPVIIASLDLILNEGDATSQTIQNADTVSTYTFSVAGDLNNEADFINFITADGKAEDDVGIVNLTMRWTLPSARVVTVTNQTFDPTEKVIKLRDYHTNEIAFDATETGTYLLEILLTDSKRTQTFKYTFELID